MIAAPIAANATKMTACDQAIIDPDFPQEIVGVSFGRKMGRPAPATTTSPNSV